MKKVISLAVITVFSFLLSGCASSNLGSLEKNIIQKNKIPTKNDDGTNKKWLNSLHEVIIQLEVNKDDKKLYEKILIKTLLKFPKIVEKSAEAKKPQILATYMLDVAQAFNKFYGNCPILKENEEDIIYSRLKLVECTKIVIENGLGILGIECPSKM